MWPRNPGISVARIPIVSCAIRQCTAVAARGSEVSPGCLLKDELVECQVGDRPTEPQVLLLQILPPTSLVGLQPALLLAPAIAGLFADRDPSARLGCHPALAEHDLNLTQLTNNWDRACASCSAFVVHLKIQTSRVDGPLRRGKISLSRSRPSTPSTMNRSCQRQTQVFDLPVAAMIATVPRPSSVRRMIRACQTCFCGDPRAATSALSRALSAEVTSISLPMHMPECRTMKHSCES